MATITWDEPQAAASPRGWLQVNGTVTGFYLDYGPDHGRIGHASTVRVLNEWHEVTWCKPDRLCADCQPGAILCVRYPGGPGTTQGSRYVETVEQARKYVETGAV